MISGTGANRTISFTPVANQSGSATVTVQVTDAAGGVSSDTFVVAVTPVNDQPTISSIADISLQSGAASGPIAFSVGDIETAAASLTVTASSNQPGLITGLILGGAGANRTITVQSKSGQPAGNAEVTVSVSDGSSTSSETFLVSVLAAIPGDSNNNGVFNSDDLLAVFQAGEYDDAIEDNSVWETGDWNGDGDFDSGDLVYAFQAGQYVPDSPAPARPATAPPTVDRAALAALVDQALALDGLWEDE